MKNYLRYFKYILPFIPMLCVQWMTGKPRYRHGIEWDKSIWSANIFRLFEKVFGRSVGIRKESTSWSTIKDGNYVIHRHFYTVESFISYCEGTFRKYLSSLFTFSPTINYQLGAIALDAATNGTTTATTPLTFSHTCTGSNLIVLVGVGSTATSPTISTPTYNSVNMTLAGAQQTNVANMAAMYWQINPSTGSQTVSVGFGGTAPNCNAVAVSYTGANQSGQPDGAGGGTGASAPNPNWTVTASNCWAACVLSAISVAGGNHTSRGGVLTLSGTHTMEFQDSNATVSTGSVTFAWGAGATTWAAEGMSFSPASTGAPVGFASWASLSISQPIIANDIQLV